MWNERTLDLGSGRTLHLREAGDGPDLVLLHGALTTAHDWATSPAAAAAAKRFRVTAMDRPGHGLSRRPRFSGTPRDQADQIASGLDRLGIERAVVAGHSFGGMVALALAERQPERVAGLVLVAPIAFPEPRFEHIMFAPRATPLLGPLFSQAAEAVQLDSAMLRKVQKIMFSPQEVPARWLDSFPRDQVLDPAAMVFEGEDAASILPLSPAGTIDFTRILAPVHILVGISDRVVEKERQGKALARLLPRAMAAEIEGAGHMLHHTHPQPVLDAILEAADAALA